MNEDPGVHRPLFDKMWSDARVPSREFLTYHCQTPNVTKAATKVRPVHDEKLEAETRRGLGAEFTAEV